MDLQICFRFISIRTFNLQRYVHICLHWEVNYLHYTHFKMYLIYRQIPQVESLGLALTPSLVGVEELTLHHMKSTNKTSDAKP